MTHSNPLVFCSCLWQNTTLLDYIKSFRNRIDNRLVLQRERFSISLILIAKEIKKKH